MTVQTQTGEKHKNLNLLCQDRWCAKQRGTRWAISLVDGTGKTDYNVEACDEVGDYITNFILNQFDGLMQFEKEKEKELFVEGIDDIIDKYAIKYNLPRKEFASTIMIICIDERSNEYCGIHLGDGILMKKENDWKIISYPENGLYANQTFLTTSSDMDKKIRFFSNSMENVSQFVMMTDGMYQYPVIKKDLVRSLETNTFKADITDDRSMIVLTKNNMD